MFKTIQGRMIGIFLGFIALMASGVAASYVILERQADDGLIVNLAGRQRMLTQKMAKESAQLANAATTQNAGHVKQEADGLAQTMRVFETTLLALRDGGSAPLNLEMTRMRPTPAASTAAASGSTLRSLQHASGSRDHSASPWRAFCCSTVSGGRTARMRIP